jgi:O-antigen/teichoic acid export membrane protein
MKSSIYILVFQGSTALLQLYILRLLNIHIPSESLGFWLTLVTITAWLQLSDFGIASSLRNRLTTLFAHNDYESAYKYINSSYKYTLVIFAVILFLALFLSGLMASYKLYYVEGLNYIDATTVILFLLIGSVLNLYFLLNSSIAYALMNPVFKPIILFIFQLVFCLLLVVWFDEDSSYEGEALVTVSLLYLIASVFANLLSLLYLFSKNRRYLPNIGKGKYSDFEEIFTVGKNFLILQIASLVMFTSDTILVANLFDYSDVVSYKVSTRVFFIFLMIQGAIMSPYWSKYTECAAKRDAIAIFNNLKKTLNITFLLLISIVLISQIGDVIVSLWMGGIEHYDPKVFLAMAIMTALMNWSSNFSTLFNGIGALKFQVHIAVATGFINIPISIFLVRVLDFGVEGIVYGTVISLAFFAIIGPLYTKRVVSEICK